METSPLGHRSKTPQTRTARSGNAFSPSYAGSHVETTWGFRACLTRPPVLECGRSESHHASSSAACCPFKKKTAAVTDHALCSWEDKEFSGRPCIRGFSFSRDTFPLPNTE